MLFCSLMLRTEGTFVHRAYRFQRVTADSNQSYQSTTCQSASPEAISVPPSAFFPQLILAVKKSKTKSARTYFVKSQRRDAKISLINRGAYLESFSTNGQRCRKEYVTEYSRCDRQHARLKTVSLESWHHHASLQISKPSMFPFLYLSNVHHSAILATVLKEMCNHEHQI